jgi:Zinc finger, C2H2 type
MPPTAVGLTGVNIPPDWHHQGMTTNAPFVQSSQYTRTDTTTNSSVHAVVPSGSSRGPVTSGMGRGPTSRYSCNICGRSYSQSQGLRRHQRERHDASLCTYCGVFEWGRPYRLREHLEEEHPDVNVEAALEEATRTRRRATSFTSHRGD